MLRMTVEGVGFDQRKQTFVVLKDWEGRKVLHIWIGLGEARAIALELEGAKPPRPLSHDLLLHCIHLVGGHIARVIVNDLQDSTFYATIDIDTPRGLRHIDSRPSDAIALAVRAKCPIFVDGGAVAALVDLEEIAASAAAAESAADEFIGERATDFSNPQEKPSDDEIDRFRRLIGEMD
jgi:uncharacterized protein